MNARERRREALLTVSAMVELVYVRPTPSERYV